MDAFWQGFFSVFTFGRSIRRGNAGSKIYSFTDAEKIADDWRRVGDDMRKAMGQMTPPLSDKD